eukprot:XP_025002186.1 26S proteasome regulatory subunit 6B-like isoform X2 [Gallus gallus]
MATNRRGHVGPGACCGRPPWTARSNSRCRPAPKAPHLLHHHRKMNLSEEVDLEDYVARPDKISGADINSICQEGGMLAVRESRAAVGPPWERGAIFGIWGCGATVTSSSW